MQLGLGTISLSRHPRQAASRGLKLVAALLTAVALMLALVETPAAAADNPTWRLGK